MQISYSRLAGGRQAENIGGNMDRLTDRKPWIKTQCRRLTPSFLSCACRTRLKRSHRLVVAIVITALGLAAASPQTLATFPGKNGRLAFASDGNGNFDIHAMNPDGSGDLDIADISAFDVEPAWSP